MRLPNPIDLQQISQTLGKDSCALCAFLRNYQSVLLKSAVPEQVDALCNFHAWAMAAAADSEAAAGVFLRLLRASKEPGASPAKPPCSVCEQLKTEEDARLQELASQLKHRMIQEWMHKHGALCLEHARKLDQIVPKSMRSLIQDILRRRMAELEQELENVRERARAGQRAGGGALGHAAEFLVSQRGIRED